MSTVLWANLLHAGQVSSDEADKPALYRHSKKLDRLSRKLGVASFLSAQDFTDMVVNLSQEELPPSMSSTDELMAQNGSWMAAQDAIEMLSQLASHIESEQVRFGFFSDDRAEILRELEESLAIAKKADRVNGQFNFSVVA